MKTQQNKILLITIGVVAVLIIALAAFLLFRPIRDDSGDPIPRGLKHTVESGVAVVTGYGGNDPLVTIPAEIDGRPVGVIGYEAFKNNLTLTGVVLPDSVVSIGVSAFSGCKNLSQVTIPQGLRSVGTDSFLNCANLLEITLPFGVETVGRGAFDGCINLKSVSLPGSVSAINEYAFRNCRSLTELVIPGSLQSIGAGVFYGCRNLVSVFFEGDKPVLTDPIYKVFYDAGEELRITYRRGALNWGTTWDDYPTEKV
ncbi:MAG: leucine-rich repeat domain-containing protein [Oscillospiraceae bacterium]|jgi:hypothetical protein|nr:leucine-rich repeat domain-containing protein [Oscillospiraceae bacterium]